MMLNILCIIGLIGYLVAMGGAWNHLWIQVKARNIAGTFVTLTILAGMMTAFGFSIITLVGGI